MAKKQDMQQQQRIVKNLPDASIPYNTSFIGDIGTLGGIRIDGNLKGKVSAGGNVTVGADGSIEGSVTACDVNIAGEIIGDIKATGTVQMLSGAKLLGDLTASSFAIEEGAYYRGQCLISNGKEPESRIVPAPEPETKKVELKKTDEKAADTPIKG